MSYNVRLTPAFQRQLKRLLKKYKSLTTDLAELGQTLTDTPELGTALGRNCYKIRMAISSKGRGKSGGSRVVTCVHVSGETIYLLSIYDKSEKDSLAEGELTELLDELDLN